MSILETKNGNLFLFDLEKQFVTKFGIIFWTEKSNIALQNSSNLFLMGEIRLFQKFWMNNEALNSDNFCERSTKPITTKQYVVTNFKQIRVGNTFTALLVSRI